MEYNLYYTSLKGSCFSVLAIKDAMCRQVDGKGRSQCETFDWNTFHLKKTPFLLITWVLFKSQRSIEIFFIALLLLILSQTLLRGRFLQSGRLVQGERPTSMPQSELGLLRQQHSVSGIRYLVSTLYLQLECIDSFVLIRCISLPYHPSKGWFYFLPYLLFLRACGRENMMRDCVLHRQTLFFLIIISSKGTMCLHFDCLLQKFKVEILAQLDNFSFPVSVFFLCLSLFIWACELSRAVLQLGVVRTLDFWRQINISLWFDCAELWG